MRRSGKAWPLHGAAWILIMLVILSGCTSSPDQAGETPPSDPFPQRIPDDEAGELPAYCSDYDDALITDAWFFVMPNVPEVQVELLFSDRIPGMALVAPEDPFQFEYSAVLGEPPGRACVPMEPNLEGISCTFSQFDQAYFGQSQPLSVYVQDCPDPIYQSEIALPAFDYSRCEFFEVFEMDAIMSHPGTYLEIYVTRSGGIPGPPSWELNLYPGFDQMPLLFSATFDNIAATEVGALDDYPGRLLSAFEIPSSYLYSPRAFKLYVNQCETPIYSEMITVYLPAAVPTTVVCQPPPGGCLSGSDWWQDDCKCGAN